MAGDIHVHAVFHLARAAAPTMLEHGAGAILLISSAAGARGCAGAIAYGVAKVPFRSSRGRWRGRWRMRTSGSMRFPGDYPHPVPG
jgi:NADP-dependent 3-hydroxy acid dehydrogenase YdfG